MEQEIIKKNRQSGRSPSYPGIDLKEALDKAKVIYENDKEHWSNVDSIARHWGYNNAKVGRASVSLAALKKFGLIEDDGVGSKRRAKLTKLALKIILDSRENSPEREKNIREAALQPSIHEEIWNEYNGSLPSDSTLTYELRMNWSFTDRGAQEFVNEFNRTIEFSGLNSDAHLASSNADTDMVTDIDEGTKMNSSTDLSKSRTPINQSNHAYVNPGKSYSLPLPGGAHISISGDFPLTNDDWDHMLRWLEFMRLGLTKKEDSSSS